MSPGDRFRAAIRESTLLLDAAMGTRLIAAGLSLAEDDPSLWNLSRPEVVEVIHRRDRAAGADALTTNTFGANRVWLSRFGMSDRIEEINRRAVALARRAGGDDGFVLGDIGPTGSAEPGAILEQAIVLADAGADALLLETFQLDQALTALDDLTGSFHLPLLVSLFRWPEDLAGTSRCLVDAGAEVLGLNCCPGIARAVEFAGRMHRASNCPLLVRPSAADPGDPAREAEQLALAFPRLVGMGVKLIGGCCGTNEVYVAALKRAWYAGGSR